VTDTILVINSLSHLF